MKLARQVRHPDAGWVVVLSLGILSLAAGCTYNANYAPEVTDSGEIVLGKAVSPLEHDLSVKGISKLDHQAKVLGIMCSANKYNDVFSPYFTAYAKALDADGKIAVLGDKASASPDTIVIAIQNARSDFRCVQTSTFEGECMARKVVVVKYSSPNGGETTQRRYEVAGGEPVRNCGSFNDALSAMGTQIMEEIEADLRAIDKST